jgi:YbbR domain-containing protein
VDGITEIFTAPVDVTEARQSFEKDVSLELNRHNIQLEGALPRVVVDIEPMSANFRIKNVDIRVLSSYKYQLSERIVSVLVRASMKDLKALDRNKIYATVDLRGKTKGQYTEPVKVTLPENIGLVKTVPEKVKVTLY